nr:hypothetical protein [Tanacetum cinerariifolium]
MPLVDYSRNSSSFSDSKHFVCSTCQKCVFNANYDACLRKILKEVNSRVKVQSLKTRNSNKPVEPKFHTQTPGRQIVTRHRVSANNSSVVHKKAKTPRSCLRWIPTCRIFNTVGLSSGLVPQPPSTTPNVLLTKNDWDTLFSPMFDEYFNASPSVAQPVLVAAIQELVVSTSTPSSMRIDQDTPSKSTSQTIKEAQSHVIPTSVKEDDHGIEVAHMDNDL